MTEHEHDKTEPTPDAAPPETAPTPPRKALDWRKAEVRPRDVEWFVLGALTALHAAREWPMGIGRDGEFVKMPEPLVRLIAGRCEHVLTRVSPQAAASHLILQRNTRQLAGMTAKVSDLVSRLLALPNPGRVQTRTLTPEEQEAVAQLGAARTAMEAPEAQPQAPEPTPEAAPTTPATPTPEEAPDAGAN